MQAEYSSAAHNGQNLVIEGVIKCAHIKAIFGLLICTLISENQGLEKSSSASNLRKISGPANLDFFLGLRLEKKS